VPERSIPIEGPVSIPNMGAPANPVETDDTSIARGEELFTLNCVPCHGADGKEPAVWPHSCNSGNQPTLPVR